MLAKMFKMMKKGNKGFTLVELMVVVVIIGVLTAIAVPVYNNASEQAKLNAIAANLRIINGAISQYQANNAGANPADSGALDGEYLQSWPLDPKGVTYAVGTVGPVFTATATFNGISFSKKVGETTHTLADGESHTLEAVLDYMAK